LSTHGKAKRDAVIDALTTGVPGDLNGLYCYILEEVQGDSSDGLDTERSAKMTRVIGFLVILDEPLELAEVDGFLSLDLSPDFDFYRFFELARSLLVPGTDQITPSTIPKMHKSFVDFITSDHAGIFQVNISNHHQKALDLSFKWMATYLRFNIYNLESSFLLNTYVPNIEALSSSVPLGLVYACRSWVSQLENCDPVRPQTLSKLRELLLERFLFWLEVIIIADWKATSRLMNRISVFLKEIPDAGPMSAFAADAAKLIERFKECISASVPHIYISMLAFAPKDSIVATHYRKKVVPVIPSPSELPPIWDSLKSDFASRMTSLDLVLSISFSPSGRHIAACGGNGHICVWNVETGECLPDLRIGHKIHRSLVHTVCFSPNGHLLASGSADRTIRLWDLNTGKCILGPFEGHTDDIHSVSFSTESDRVASGSADKAIRIWDVRTGHCVLGPLEGHTDTVYSVSYSPDGLYIASGSRDHTIRLWDSKTGSCVLGPQIGHSAAVCSVSFSPDGRLIISGSFDQTLRIWSSKTGSTIGFPLHGHTRGVKSVSFSPNGRYIVSGSSDNTIRIWDVQTGSCVSGPLGGHSNYVHSVCFSPDGRYIASGSQDTTIRIWDVEAILSGRSCDSAIPHNVLVGRLKGQAALANFSGWTLGPDEEQLCWVPQGHREAIWRPATVRILGRTTMIKLDLSNLITGREWLDCFLDVHSPPT
jgi:WD40 repeat protein